MFKRIPKKRTSSHSFHSRSLDTGLLHGASRPASISKKQAEPFSSNSGSSFNFRNIPVLSPSPLVQAKLSMGQAGDKYEQEADRVANQIVRSPGIGRPRSIGISQRTGISGKFVAQPKGGQGVVAAHTPGFAAGIQPAQGGGRPLSRPVRGFFESRLGHDFSGVRIHDGPNAASAAQSINARAFTMGNNISFARGQYQPDSLHGKKLLAHELTHVVQQSGDAHTSGNSENAVPQVQCSTGSAAESPRIQGKVNKQNMKTLRQYRKLLQDGTLNAMQIVLIEEKLERADSKLRELNKLASAGSGSKQASAGAMVLVGGLVADDATGIGVADDVAIPFVLLAAGILYLAHVASRTSSADLAAAESEATAAIQDAIHAMSQAISKPRVIPRVIPRTKSKRKKKGPLPIFWPHFSGKGLAIVAPNPVNSISLGRGLVRTKSPARNTSLIGTFKKANTVRTGQAVHHVTPLFLGGPDALGNLSAVWISYHIAGHTALRIQPQLAFYGVSTDLYRHPPGTPYVVTGIV